MDAGHLDKSLYTLTNMEVDGMVSSKTAVLDEQGTPRNHAARQRVCLPREVEQPYSPSHNYVPLWGPIRSLNLSWFYQTNAGCPGARAPPTP